LAESGAIIEYILAKYGQGKLSIPVDGANFADYLYFFHFANSYFLPALSRAGLVRRSGMDPDGTMAKLARHGSEVSLKMLEDRLTNNTWLAGEEFTAADVMNFFILTTWRLFFPYSLEGYDAILSYMQRISKRDGYKRALAKGDPGYEPPLGAENTQVLKV
jgi:glutathione S-transferase